MADELDTAIEQIAPIQTDNSPRAEDGPQPTLEEMEALLAILEEEEAE